MMMRNLCFALALVAGQAAFATDIEALVEEQFQVEWRGAIPDGATVRITYSPKLPDAVALNAFWADSGSGQFVADAFREDGSLTRVSGFAMVMVQVPVPARQMQPGEILRASDLNTVELPARRINTFAVTDKDALVGQEVRRLLNAGHPIMAQSVMAPRLVERGEHIRIVFQDGGLNLTATGRALSDAALGDDVKVVNLSSNQSVVGIATADGIVEVSK
ncbi:MAG: flagellar basal body P-ring formation chaperone FlgA [Pseudomonadota bacterium]